MGIHASFDLFRPGSGGYRRGKGNTSTLRAKARRVRRLRLAAMLSLPALTFPLLLLSVSDRIPTIETKSMHAIKVSDKFFNDIKVHLHLVELFMCSFSFLRSAYHRKLARARQQKWDGTFF